MHFEKNPDHEGASKNNIWVKNNAHYNELFGNILLNTNYEPRNRYMHMNIWSRTIPIVLNFKIQSINLIL